MKKAIALLIMFLAFTSLAYGFESGSTGTDGPFNPQTNTILNTPANGVFNFTSVNIPAGVTVTFIPNAANTPVYILATNDVTISGTLSVDGGNAIGNISGAGGPGGYAGGRGGFLMGAGGSGFGPGGGGAGPNSCGWGGGGGGFGSSGGGSNFCQGGGGSAYGDPKLVPIIGGSGGGGGGGNSNEFGGGGGGGAGAVLIASSGTISVMGNITANGGSGASGASCGGGGSAGAVRLVANIVQGTGKISAVGGWGNYGGGGSGRVEIETAIGLSFSPSNSNPGYNYSTSPYPIFIANTPSLQITSVAGISVPATPTGSYTNPDITLPSGVTNPVTIGLSATNIPIGTVINTCVVPQNGSQTCVNSTQLSGTNTASTATASVNLTTLSVVTASVTFTLQTAMYYNGEKIDKVMVASEMGKGSKVTYVTESGKKIPSEKLLASLWR